MLKKLSIIAATAIVTTSSLTFAETNETNPKAEKIERNMINSLKNDVMHGAISPQEYGAAINQIHSIKEAHENILNEESATKYKNTPAKTSLPIISWETIGISKAGDIFERIEKLYTPEGWLVKVITINKSIYHSSEDIKYMYIPDAQHKWKS